MPLRRSEQLRSSVYLELKRALMSLFFLTISFYILAYSIWTSARGLVNNYSIVIINIVFDIPD